MVFNFRLSVNGQEAKEFPLESGAIFKTAVLLSKGEADPTSEITGNCAPAAEMICIPFSKTPEKISAPFC